MKINSFIDQQADENYPDYCTGGLLTLDREHKEKREIFLKGARTVLLLNMCVEFAKWLKHLDNGTSHYDPHTGKETQSIGFSPYECYIDNLKTEEELFQFWIENIYEADPPVTSSGV